MVSSSITNAQVEVKVWLRAFWTDTRLTWDAHEWGNITYISFKGTDFAHEMGEIWLPDLQPYNSVASSSSTLNAAMGQIMSDGRVFWSRPGTLNVLCTYHGLANFPFDKIVCPMEIGGREWSARYQGFELADPPVSIASELTSGTGYQEVRNLSGTATIRRLAYGEDGSAFEAAWPVALFSLRFQRAAMYYIQILIIPIMSLTVLSFSPFFVGSDSGRLSFGITLLLMLAVYQLIVAESLPVADALLWIEWFLILQYAFSTAAIAEGAVVLFLAQHDEAYLIPEWIVANLRATLRSCGCCFRGTPRVTPRSDTSTAEKEKELGELASYTSSVCRRRLKGRFSAWSRKLRADAEEGTDWFMRTGILLEDELGEDAVGRLLFFERCYLQLFASEKKFGAGIPFARVQSFLAYVTPHLDTQELVDIMLLVDNEDAAHGEGDLLIVRSEFMEICMQALWRMPIPLLESAVGNFLKAENVQATSNVAKWKAVGRTIDRCSR